MGKIDLYGWNGVLKTTYKLIMTDKTCIWLIDPGLMEAGGHHAALIETLLQCHENESNTCVNMSVFAHQQVDKILVSKLEKYQILVEPLFKTVFYQYFETGSDLGPAGIASYVRKLAAEYKQVILRSQQSLNLNRIVMFFPCLNWEHAWALGLAINTLKPQLDDEGLQFVCCAMYNPVAENKCELKPLWYKMAFELLLQHKNISLYASEFELNNAYQSLLSKPLAGTHPCYLMEWPILNRDELDNFSDDLKLNNNTILLYVGDAKVSKGFTKLPELLNRLLKQEPSDRQFLIQFTLAWEYPELAETLAYLKQFAAAEPRLILHQGFWSNQQLANAMYYIKYAVCTYDTDVYQRKSSGLLWMLAYFDCPFIIEAECWLTREAQRLGLNYKVSERLVNVSEPIDMEHCSVGTIATDESYSRTLYKPVIDWLSEHQD